MASSPQAIISPPTAFGLIIGIGKYKDSRIPALNYTPADARSMYNLLLNHEHLGFKNENVKLLLDDEASFFKIKNAISGWLFQHATTDSTVIVYFAGHGGQESDKTGMESDGISKYLLPWDCDRDDLFSSALSNMEFNRLLSTIKAKRLVFFMDACYAGGVTRAGARDIGVVDDLREKIGQGEGRIIISSAKANQRSWEDEKLGHGIFTYHLLEALEGKADLDNDGYVSIWEVYKYLEQKVPHSVKQIAQSLQEPLLYGDISKDIYLTVNSKRVEEKLLEFKKQEEEKHAILVEKQNRLFKFFTSKEINRTVYNEALDLLDKSPGDYSLRENRLRKNLEALINGGISPEVYLDNREMILDTPDKPQPGKSSRDVSASQKFCTNCGTPLKQGMMFCTGCGKRYG